MADYDSEMMILGHMCLVISSYFEADNIPPANSNQYRFIKKIMKKVTYILTTICCILTFASCNKSKDPTPDNQSNTSGNLGNTSGSGSTTGGGSTGGGTSTSTITYINASFTSINITVNGVAKTIAVGGNVVYTGTPNAAATGTATTSGKTSSGTIVGSTYTWTLNNTFPISGSLNNTLNVGGDMFFLKVKNISSKPITKLYVNYGLVNQTLDNVTIANDSQVYGLGYYKAFSNSNVRGESGTNSWSWNSLNLPFTANQLAMVQAN